MALEKLGLIFTFIRYKQTTIQTSKVYYAKLSGSFAPIFYFNCEHFLFVHCKTITYKKFADLKKDFMDFLNSIKIQFSYRLIFEILIILKPPGTGVIWGPTQNLGQIGCAVLTLIGYKQTDRPAKYIYIFIEIVVSRKRWNNCLLRCFF